MKINENYKKLIDMGYEIESRCGRGNFDRVYLCKNGKRVLQENYGSSRGRGNGFDKAYRNSHKDRALARFLKELEEIKNSVA